MIDAKHSASVWDLERLGDHLTTEESDQSSSGGDRADSLQLGNASTSSIDQKDMQKTTLVPRGMTLRGVSRSADEMLNTSAQHHRGCVQDICWQIGRHHFTSVDVPHCQCDGFAISSSAQSPIALVVSLYHHRQRLNALAMAISLITTYVTAFIADGIIPDKWRWELRMLAIIMPALSHVTSLLYYTQRKARKLDVVSLAHSGDRRKKETCVQILKGLRLRLTCSVSISDGLCACSHPAAL